ncbi:MAG: hypothetical protein V7707_18330 [Motiliproteus sp.]
MPKKPDPRTERNQKGAYALRDLLRLICSEPQRFADNDALLSALKSQEATAKLELEFKDAQGKRTTRSMSKNTLEKYAHELFDRGYKGLEDLRKGALDAIEAFKERGKGANKRTKTGLNKKVEELEQELEFHKKTNLVLLQGLSAALWGMKEIKEAPSPAVRDKRADENMTKLRAIVSLNSPPFDQLQAPTNVIELESFRDGED